MTGRELRRGAVGPVLRDDLLAIGERRADVEEFLRLTDVLRLGIQRGWSRPKRIPSRKGKWRDQAPVWRQKRRCSTVRKRQRLPTIGIGDLAG